MSVLLSCQMISKSFLGKALFEDFQFSIHEGDRIGLIGSNGSGKSTLLKILVDHETIDSGEVTKRSNLRVAYIPQIESFEEERTVFDTLINSAQEANVADVEAIVNITLGRCGFTDKNIQVSCLSGGWKKRLSLACGFVKDAELLLLDEPTNHLDLDGVLWLEQYLKDASFTWLVVSHDRIFLDTSTNRIAEIDRAYPQGVFAHEGGLGDFLKMKSAFLATEQQRINSLENKIRREKEWLSRNPKARGTKSKSRIDRAYDLMHELSEVKSRMHRSESEIDFTGSDRKTKRLVEAFDVSKSLGSKSLIQNSNFVLSPGMKIGVLGANGSGKTTLLKVIAGEIETDSGSINRAINLRTVYFDQHRARLNQEISLKDTLAPASDAVVYQGREIHVVSWAARFQFRPEQLGSLVKELSGGEQSRLLIALLMLEEADLLLLDEPTNDLDIETLEVLEESLLEFSGAVVLVSHDRYLMGRVCNGFLGLSGKGRLTPYASVEQWLQAATVQQAPVLKEQKLSAVQISYEERKEYARIERSIAKAEEKVGVLEARVGSPEIASDAEKLEKIYQELGEAKQALEDLYMRWEELEEKR